MLRASSVRAIDARSAGAECAIIDHDGRAGRGVQLPPPTFSHPYGSGSGSDDVGRSRSSGP